MHGENLKLKNIIVLYILVFAFIYGRWVYKEFYIE